MATNGAAVEGTRPAEDLIDHLDWAVAGLSAGVIVGFYVDLWAHEHGRVGDMFLTPWHAILYAGVGRSS